MKRTKRVLSFAGVLCLALVGVWMVKPACACVPLEYAEVAIADLPAQARSDAQSREPGLIPERAWIFAPGISGYDVRKGKGQGYLIRGRVPGGWWGRDVKVPFAPEPPTQDDFELHPIP